MFVLVLDFLFRSAKGPAEFLLNMLGEQVLCATVLGSTALLNIALVPHFGTKGAASTTAISLMTASLMNYVVVRRRLDIEISIWRNVGRRSETGSSTVCRLRPKTTKPADEVSRFMNFRAPGQPDHIDEPITRVQKLLNSVLGS
ncbi:MAG: hypothetical protein ACWGMY_05315 [Hyphomicrobiaceae bacterium]